MPLNVEDEGRIVSSQDVTLPPDGESATVRVRFTANDAGARAVPLPASEPQPGEQVTQNNARDALVEVARSPREGALLRRRAALRGEVHPRAPSRTTRTSQVVILQRTAENKYLRLDVGSPDELVGGFPKTREELFAYRAIILGSVEAASFTPDQLRMLADFVSKRGGGLLMLGGRRSFAEGGWAGTPVAEVLPVEFDERPRGNSDSATTSRSCPVQPTRAGATYPVTQIADDREGVGGEVGRACRR